MLPPTIIPRATRMLFLLTVVMGKMDKPLLPLGLHKAASILDITVLSCLHSEEGNYNWPS